MTSDTMHPVTRKLTPDTAARAPFRLVPCQKPFTASSRLERNSNSLPQSELHRDKASFQSVLTQSPITPTPDTTPTYQAFSTCKAIFSPIFSSNIYEVLGSTLLTSGDGATNTRPSPTLGKFSSWWRETDDRQIYTLSGHDKCLEEKMEEACLRHVIP